LEEKVMVLAFENNGSESSGLSGMRVERVGVASSRLVWESSMEYDLVEKAGLCELERAWYALPRPTQMVGPTTVHTNAAL
jgi:hypothetical protein